MDGKSKDIFKSINLANDDAKKLHTVIQNFDDHFAIIKFIFERAKFNMRCHEPG